MALEAMGIEIPVWLLVGLGVASVVIPWTVRGWVERARWAKWLNEFQQEVKAFESRFEYDTEADPASGEAVGASS